MKLSNCTGWYPRQLSRCVPNSIFTWCCFKTLQKNGCSLFCSILVLIALALSYSWFNLRVTRYWQGERTSWPEECIPHFLLIFMLCTNLVVTCVMGLFSSVASLLQLIGSTFWKQDTCAKFRRNNGRKFLAWFAYFCLVCCWKESSYTFRIRTTYIDALQDRIK